MAAKFLVLCASALFVQAISAIPCGCGTGAYNAAPIVNLGGCGYGNSGYGNIISSGGCGYGNSGYGNIIAASSASSSGGGLGVSTSCPISPNGISVLSQNDITGLLSATGNLPVLAAVAFEGLLPTSGSAGTSYSCGNGQVGIDSNSLAANGLSASSAYGSGVGLLNAGNLAGLSYNGGCGAPIQRNSCGCY